MENLVDNNKAD